MNRRTFLAGCSTLLGLAAPAFSGEPTKPDIPRLIEQLGSREFAERAAAAKALDDFGGPALAPLWFAARCDRNAAVRRRATCVVQALAKKVHALVGHHEYPFAAAFSPDDRWVLSRGEDYKYSGCGHRRNQPTGHIIRCPKL